MWHHINEKIDNKIFHKNRKSFMRMKFFYTVSKIKYVENWDMKSSIKTGLICSWQRVI